MAKTPSPTRTKPAARRASKAAAAVEAAAAPAPRRAAAKKAKPAAAVVAAVPAPAPAAKPAKAHKPKLVRDSFTMPKDEYQALDTLKARALGLEKHVRKSELLRAGLQALGAMNDRAFLNAIGAVPTLKTGRPKSA